MTIKARELKPRELKPRDGALIASRKVKPVGKFKSVLPPSKNGGYDGKGNEITVSKIVVPDDILIAKDKEDEKNKKTKKITTIAERKAVVGAEGKFKVIKNQNIDKKGKKKEWIMNNSKSDVIINKSAKTVIDGKNYEGCIIVHDYVHMDVLTKDDMETPEFKNLVRKNILEFVSSSQILDSLKSKATTLLESNYEPDQILARRLNNLSIGELNYLLRKSIIKRVEYIDEATLNRINWFITSSMREKAKLPEDCVVDEQGHIVKEKNLKKVLVDLGSSGHVEVPTSRGTIKVACETLNIDDESLLENEKGSSFMSHDENIEKLENEKRIILEKENKEKEKKEEQNIENLVNNGIEALKKILVKTLISMSK